MKHATVNLFVGWHGADLYIGPGTEWPDDHPVVRAHPDWFTDASPAESPKPKRRAARKAAAVEQQPETRDDASDD